MTKDENDSVEEEIGGTSTASVAFPPTAMPKGLQRRYQTINMTDRRYRKDQPPRILKRFRKYLDNA
jgi:hypothetical protein